MADVIQQNPIETLQIMMDQSTPSEVATFAGSALAAGATLLLAGGRQAESSVGNTLNALAKTAGYGAMVVGGLALGHSIERGADRIMPRLQGLRSTLEDRAFDAKIAIREQIDKIYCLNA